MPLATRRSFGFSARRIKTAISKSAVSNGLAFDSESYRAAETCLAFSYLQAVSEGNSSLASQSIPTSNQIISWLKEIETLRKVLPEVSGLPLVMGN